MTIETDVQQLITDVGELQTTLTDLYDQTVALLGVVNIQKSTWEGAATSAAASAQAAATSAGQASASAQIVLDAQAVIDEAETAAAAASAAMGQIESNKQAAVDAAAEAQKWANFTGGEVVAGQGYSAKKHANDASTSATAAATSASNSATSETKARDWATKPAGEVTAGQGYSALYHATASASSAALAQNWATKTDAEVAAGQGYGAKKYANDASASATLAQNWATSLTAFTGSSGLFGARKYANDAATSEALAKDWASKARGTLVNATHESAYSYALQAADSAATAVAAANQAGSGQEQADWAQTDAAQKSFIRNKPSLSGNLNTDLFGRVVTAAGAYGFSSATYQVNTRNPIWRFGNADAYGMSYFQGTAGYQGVDSIDLHFGTATSAGSKFSFNYDGHSYFRGINKTHGFQAKGGDGAELLRSYNTTASGEPAQFYIAHNYGDVTIGNSRGNVTLLGHATYATNATRLYASNAPYIYGGSNPYYMAMNYDSGQNRWRLSANPGTPATIGVHWADSAGDSAALGGYSSNRTMQKRRREIGNAGPSMNSLRDMPAEYGFAYATDGSLSGPFMHFGGLAYDGDYAAQFSLSYSSNGNAFRFRTFNGDNAGAWNPWYDVYHTGNLAPSVSAGGNTVVLRNAYGYLLGNYINMTDDGNPGANTSNVTAIICKKGDDYYRSTSASDVKKFLGINELWNTTIQASENLNSYYALAGFYRCLGSPANLPTGVSGDGQLISSGNPNNDTSAQIYMPYNESAMYIRTANQWGSNWKGWARVMTDSGWWSSRCYPRRQDGPAIDFRWEGQGGTPPWLWGGSDGVNMYVYNPANFSVNYANVAGNTQSVAGATHTNNTWTGMQAIQTNAGSTAGTTNYNNWNMRVQSTDGGGAVMSFLRSGIYGLNVGLDTDSIFRIGGFSYDNSRLQLNCFSGDLTLSGNVTAYSDERLKKNWRPVQEGFVLKLSRLKSGVFERTDTGETQAGVSAQGMQDLLPETVIADKDGILSVNYGAGSMVSAVELAKELVVVKDQLKQALEVIEILKQKVGI